MRKCSYDVSGTPQHLQDLNYLMNKIMLAGEGTKQRNEFINEEYLKTRLPSTDKRTYLRMNKLSLARESNKLS